VKCLPTRSMPLKGLISGSCPSAREFVPRFLRTRPYGRRPCVSLAVCLHQARQGTLAPKLLIMLGTQKKTARKGGLEGELSENYKFILRRRTPARPSTPVPNMMRVPGSGTADVE